MQVILFKDQFVDSFSMAASWWLLCHEYVYSTYGWHLRAPTIYREMAKGQLRSFPKKNSYLTQLSLSTKPKHQLRVISVFWHLQGYCNRNSNANFHFHGHYNHCGTDLKIQNSCQIDFVCVSVQSTYYRSIRFGDVHLQPLTVALLIPNSRHYPVYRWCPVLYWHENVYASTNLNCITNG